MKLLSIPFAACAALLITFSTPSGAQTRLLTIEEALQTALKNRAEFRAADAAIEARAAVSLQATARPNPTLSIQTENWRGWGSPSFTARDVDVFAFVSAPIETGGKRGRRIELARTDERIAELRKQALDLAIHREASRAYWAALGAEQRRELLAEGVESWRRLSENTQIRLDLGAGSELELIQVQIEQRKAEIALASAVLGARQAQIELARTIGIAPIDGGFALRRPAAKQDAAPPNDAAFATALRSRPEILLGESAIASARAATELAQAQAKPNATPYFGYKRASGQHTLVGGVSTPLPFFNRSRYRGRIAQAGAEVRRLEAELDAVRSRVQADVTAALEALRERERILRSIEGEMLSQAAQTAEISEAAYQEGGVTLLTVIDARRGLNEVRLLRQQADFDYATARIDMESALGTGPEFVRSDPN